VNVAAAWAAPGRVNLIGEHVDYNEGLVLPFALPMTATARVTTRSDHQVDVRSAEFPDAQSFSTTVQPGEVSGWARYVAGVVWTMDDRPGRPGLDVEVQTEVPIGAGLSSSAALECAVAAAVNDVWRCGLDPAELARRCRRAENEFVGVPTGPMDQLASLLCTEGHALLIDCRDLTSTQVPLDLSGSGLRLLVVDTGARHELADSAYADRRSQCAAAAAALGVPSLRDATVDGVRSMTEPVLQRRAHHVVSEIGRVEDVAELLRAGHPGEIGAFLTASHESLRDDYEVSCPELDVAVEEALAAGALGARLTGGGFGGCAITLCRDGDVDRVVDRVEAAYRASGWPQPTWWVAVPSRGAHPLPRGS
jgi:galactokinase